MRQKTLPAGYAPWVRRCSDKECGFGQWERVPLSDTRRRQIKDLVGSTDGHTEFKFFLKIASGEVVEIAHSVPYTYYMMESWVKRHALAHFAGNSRVLCNTIEGRNVHLLQLNAHSVDRKVIAARQAIPREVGTHQSRTKIFLSGRVHPSETPGQWALMGALDWLNDAKDPRAVALSQRYEIWTIPMLNPDGVAKGYFRCNSAGLDLNRCYGLGDGVGGGNGAKIENAKKAA